MILINFWDSVISAFLYICFMLITIFTICWVLKYGKTGLKKIYESKESKKYKRLEKKYKKKQLKEKLKKEQEDEKNGEINQNSN